MTIFFAWVILQSVATGRLTQYQVESGVIRLVKALYVDVDALQKKIDDSGLKPGFIADKLGLTRQGFWKKKKGIIPFRVPEVYVLCDLLNISNEERVKIFYPKEQPQGC